MIEIVKVLLAILCAGIPFFVGQRMGLMRFASPMHVVAYLAFLGFTVKSIVFAFAPDLAFYSGFFVTDEDIGWGYFYLTTFIVAMCIGYALFANKQRHVPAEDVTDFTGRIRTPALILALGIISAIVTTYIYFYLRDIGQIDADSSLDTLRQLNAGKVTAIAGRQDFGNSFAIVKLLYVIPATAFALLLFRYMEYRDQRSLLYILIMIGVLILAAIIKGNRRDLLDMMLIALGVFSLSGTKVIRRAVIAGIVASPLILVTFSFMSNLRDRDVNLEQDELVSVESLRPIVSSTYFLDINIPLLIRAYTRDDQMLNGVSYLNWTYAWIPRAIWPEKPAVDIGPYIKQDILGFRGTGGFNATAAGEAFLNFGWFGIVIGALLGLMLRKIEELLLSRRWLVQRVGGLIYVVAFLTGMQSLLQSSFSAAMVSMAAQAVVVWIFALFVVKGMGRRPRRAAVKPGARAPRATVRS